jgi:hypothetical protein
MDLKEYALGRWREANARNQAHILEAFARLAGEGYETPLDPAGLAWDGARHTAQFEYQGLRFRAEIALVGGEPLAVFRLWGQCPACQQGTWSEEFTRPEALGQALARFTPGSTHIVACAGRKASLRGSVPHA